MSTILQAAETTVWKLIAAQARENPQAIALIEGQRHLTYARMIAECEAIATDLTQRGITRGDRIAVLSENRSEYSLIQLACAKLGIMVACLNWRLVAEELAYCIDLVDPRILIASPRMRALAADATPARAIIGIRDLGALRDLDRDIAPTVQNPAPDVAGTEDGWHIIYTSGTTGRPKAAVISQRAQIARMAALRLDLGLARDDCYLSWAPMFHIGGTEHLFSTLLIGGTAIVMDGFDADGILDVLENHKIGWLLTIPATNEKLVAALNARKPTIKGVKVVGCMADMVPVALIDEICNILGAKFLNSFGATETGMPPLSGDLISAGTLGSGTRSLAKRLSVLTELRLVGPDGHDVPQGTAGEAWVRGPTLFSGYWNNPDTNAKDFAEGWFHMGDLFRRDADGYTFAGRSKYLIKSGGENIYPAEIERVLLADPRITEAVVVRRADEKWGEVPVAIIATSDATLTPAEVQALCRSSLASYKCPKDIVFLPLDSFTRSTSGKVIREELERLVAVAN